MEEILQEFNDLIEEMANAVANAKDEKAAIELQNSYDEQIEKAEQKAEKELEELFKKEQQELEKEQKESEIPEEEEDDKDEDDKEEENETSKIEKEIEFLKSNAKSFSFIQSRYNRNNTNKNGFSTLEIFKYLKGNVKITRKVDMSKYIFDTINKNNERQRM